MANLELLDPFAQDYPESLTASLAYGHATCARFSPRGDHLAAGLADGAVVIWDFVTAGISRLMRGHTRTVQSVCWSRDGRFLLSAARDWRTVLWDLADGSRKRSVSFEAPIWGADIHPYNHLMFVASLYEDKPVLVDIACLKAVKHILPSIPRRLQTEDDDDGEINEKQAAQDAKQLTLVSIYDRTGNYIYTGTSKGWLNVVWSNRLTSSNIKHIRLSPMGRDLVVNASDRIIRTLVPTNASTLPETIDFAVEHKFQDVVNRFQWNACGFSSNGDYVMASTFKEHDIYVWERTMGSLVKMLEGPREELTDVDWHPTRPVVTALGLESGIIYIWATSHSEGWSTFAPDFKELEENIEYEEREDEFDMLPEEEASKRKQHDEDEDVDITTITHARGDHGFLLPVILDPNEEEDSIPQPCSPKKRNEVNGKPKPNGKKPTKRKRE
ncbi:Set1 complex component swd1 [Neolecta irregularis DAH-3]|uniref:Set1 complex component swd1 n=1 Tax=Neolecta irregularis (strain DAH-3) TaxID=1198029 RepID=A0A1U7LJ68_NEOID|nr:Set1 complex component swd1 [Neolecta irregularis DAH-3]|eukprot:OLL22689.1 Set1 complex component swd1 [Neolecta irregularis DAH-3]